ncbi:hypothetical protein P3T76_011556 [Phytophthora citrophthora]|uniref:HAT C-terminal dimerisation domain-containing protein n=1 Tax=Phytophthora citrophthora TaxID=4793 RepID=A0AAD9G8K7_9STRA|nr:hypothetical protein P3T76_011556 [Phytophthora citrophthora]
MAFTYQSSPNLTDKIRVLGDVDFWTKLETAEKIVLPLCSASFRLQRDENTVADVVISFMDIYRGFASTELGDSLTDLVETRWNACEQPLFIIGLFLHPEYIVNARSLPPTVITELDDVCQFAQYYYRRFVNENDSGLRGEMFAWIQGIFTTSRFVDFNCDAVSMFWEYEKNTKMNSKLPLLALTILSIAVNTATCERLFSELALIQTPRRNRMAIEKTMKHQIMRQYVRNKNRLERPIPTSSKKLLRTVDPRERQSVATPVNSTRTTPANPTPIANRTPGLVSAVARTPARELQDANGSPHSRLPAQDQSPPLVRVLFPDLNGVEAISADNISQRPPTTPSRHTAPLTHSSPAPPTVEHVNGIIRQNTAPVDDNTVGNLTAELDTDALSNTLLEEYLEHFDWEEIGEYGDEATVGIWDRILNAPRVFTSSNTNGDTGYNSSANMGDDTDENARNEGATEPFTTTRIGSHADPIPAPNRQPFPQNNDTNFLQKKRLSGIRSRKTSLASLMIEG